MINSHVHSACIHPMGEREKEGKKGKKKESLSQYISHDYSRVYSMEIGITYLYPYDDDGNSNDSIFLSRRQERGGHGSMLADTRRTFAYDESKTITIQSLCAVSFACYRLPCHALHTATVVGWRSKYAPFFHCATIDPMLTSSRLCAFKKLQTILSRVFFNDM